MRSAALIVITTLSGCLSLGDTESDPTDASGADGNANGYDSGIWPDAALDAPTGGVAGTAGGGTGGGVAGAGIGGGGGGSGGCPACGCGVDFQTDNANCGACGVSCQRPHAVQGCNAGNCTGFTCIGYWLNCNNDKSDGCEISGANTDQHCGACFAKCNETNASATSCSNAECSHACKTGYGDCNGPLPGLTDDGCETNLYTNSAHCGACGAVCGAGYTCQSGACESGG